MLINTTTIICCNVDQKRGGTTSTPTTSSTQSKKRRTTSSPLLGASRARLSSHKSVTRPIVVRGNLGYHDLRQDYIDADSLADAALIMVRNCH